MTREDAGRRWRRLLDLLEPIHTRAAGTARRLSRDAAEGDDLLQAAVLRAFDKLDGLRDPVRFPAWFFAVLLSVHRNRSRADFWRRFLPLDDLSRHPAAGDDEEERRQSAGRVSRALRKLSAPQRQAVVLFEIEGFSVREIAEMQATTESCVKSRLKRGRERLRRHYERLGFGDRRGRAGEGRLAAKGDLL